MCGFGENEEFKAPLIDIMSKHLFSGKVQKSAGLIEKLSQDN